MTDFSVLLPVYGQDTPQHFRSAIRSVTTDQLRRPAEVVIVQDGPVPSELAQTIATVAAESPVPVRLHRLPVNAGLAYALTVGLGLCQHDIIARMDADDISAPERFSRQLPLLEAGADLVGTGMYEFVDSGQVVAQRTPPTGPVEIAALATFHDPFNHPTVVYRRGAVEAAGGYRELPLMEDYWLFARMIQAGAVVANLADPLVRYRIDESYDRRGGWQLFRSELRLQRVFRATGFTTIGQQWRNLLIRGGYRFIPVSLRKALYRRRFSRPTTEGNT